MAARFNPIENNRRSLTNTEWEIRCIGGYSGRDNKPVLPTRFTQSIFTLGLNFDPGGGEPPGGWGGNR